LLAIYSDARNPLQPGASLEPQNNNPSAQTSAGVMSPYAFLHHVTVLPWEWDESEQRRLAQCTYPTRFTDVVRTRFSLPVSLE
jgi:hypothetical protein